MRGKMLRLIGLVWLVASMSGIANADGLIIIDTPLPRPISSLQYAFAPLEVKYHNVGVTIADRVAMTDVDQVFFNPNDQRLEGTYIFPIPNDAQIDKFSMDINGKMMDAELLDADKARGIYEEIVRKMKDPALMEYAGQRLFKVRIFPIEPHSDKRIRLKYTELLRSDSGLMHYVYPLSTEKYSSRALKSVSIKVDLTCQQGIKSVYSPSHTVEIKRHGNGQAVIGFEAADVKPDTDFELFYSPASDSEVGIDLLAHREANDAESGYFALLISPTAQMATEKIVQKDVVFVLDTSGSMADSHKIDQAKRALTFCLTNLNTGDRFNLVRFSTEPQPLFEKLVNVNGANIDKAVAFVNDLKPIGGTAIEDALLKALEPADNQAGANRPYVIVFLTDGLPTIGSTDENQIISKVIKSIDNRTIRIFCFGLGTDVNTHLLDRLSDETHAISQYVLPMEDIEVKVSNFFTKINQPVLADVHLKFTGAITPAKMYPAKLPDLFKGEQLLVFGRYDGQGGAAVTLTGTVNGQTRSYTYEATFPAKTGSNAFIPRLWATRRIGFLLDEIRLHGESKELRDEVAELARKYGIVTPYTAYLIVEDESRRQVPVAQRTLQMIDQDKEMRAETGRIYEEINTKKSGGAAVGGAQAFDALKKADTAAAPSAANAYAMSGQAGTTAGRDIVKAVQSQQTRYLRGRTFYQNGTQWIDANVQAHPNARKVQLKFGSDDYFAVIKRHPDAAQWLSIGKNMQLLLEDTIYNIVE